MPSNSFKIRRIKHTSDKFPDALKTIPSPPKEIYAIGNLSLLAKQPSLAVVGSRRVSPYGRQVTSQLIEELAAQNIVIISGLALGVDAIAHRAALDVKGATIAVLACGLDTLYPATNTRLGHDILNNGGLIISEYPEGTPPLRQHFIARNRLVSGLGYGVLITEAAAKSGTLHTAGFALEQGKTVFTVPGNITSPLSAGTNNLIKTGALPVTEASDVLFALGIKAAEPAQQQIFGDNKEQAAILELLARGVTDGGELLNESGLEAQDFNQALTMLELVGKIRPLGAGHWSLA